MSSFFAEDFLLDTATARRLYHGCAAALPIIDWHCHLSAKELAENLRYNNLSQAWLGADHYKWRAMRCCGVDERLITGEAEDLEKLRAFAACMPRLAGNPLYAWTHLELKGFFGIGQPLSPATADEIYSRASDGLQKMPVRTLLLKSNVKLICTTDDPADTLEYHERLAQEYAEGEFPVRVLPAFRTDAVLCIEKPGYAAYLKKLGGCAGTEIRGLEELKAALRSRMDYFQAHGCRAADQSFTSVPKLFAGESEMERLLQKALRGEEIGASEAEGFRGSMLLFLAEEYAKRAWGMELHMGPIRNANTALFKQLGADAGGDITGESLDIQALAGLLDKLNESNSLPNTVLFSLNPNDNAALCALCGAFGGRVRQGSAWWFNDSLNGMLEQLTTYASMLPLGEFLGFVTDSRSYLSYPRHEYFRRLLCALLGKWAESGEYAADMAALRELVKAVCVGNCMEFFGFDELEQEVHNG
ncbi:MAG: glucuronate isomerase [Clostridium sp.]|nr:glucuronate isomerase [Clostridium sp.]